METRDCRGSAAWAARIDQAPATSVRTRARCFTVTPLAESKAIQLAEAQLETYTAMPRAYRLDTVEWLHIGNHTGDARKWIYIVNFERQREFEGQRFQARGTLRIPVLLDGRVVEGKKE